MAEIAIVDSAMQTAALEKSAAPVATAGPPEPPTSESSGSEPRPPS